MLSGDDALAWLQSLSAGKEDELRAQAEVEQQARVDEIMGRKRPAPQEEVEEKEELPAGRQVTEPEEETAPTEPEAIAEEEEVPDWLRELEPPAEKKMEEEPLVGEQLPTEAEEVAPLAEEAVAPPAAPTEEGEMLSGDDALAWLQSLSAGKEDELRAQAEVEQQARVDEIMGRKRPAPQEEVAEKEELPAGRQVTEPEEETAPTEPEAIAEEEEVPDWLRELEPPAEKKTEEEPLVGEQLPTEAEEVAPLAEEAVAPPAARPPRKAKCSPGMMPWPGCRASPPARKMNSARKRKLNSKPASMRSWAANVQPRRKKSKKKRSYPLGGK